MGGLFAGEKAIAEGYRSPRGCAMARRQHGFLRWIKKPQIDNCRRRAGFSIVLIGELSVYY